MQSNMAPTEISFEPQFQLPPKFFYGFSAIDTAESMDIRMKFEVLTAKSVNWSLKTNLAQSPLKGLICWIAFSPEKLLKQGYFLNTFYPFPFSDFHSLQPQKPLAFTKGLHNLASAIEFSAPKSYYSLF